MLSDIEPEVLSVGVAHCIKHCKYMPTIAEIRESCQNALSIASDKQTMGSAEAWKKVQRAIASVGYTGTPHFNDEALQAVVERFGWREICMTPVDDTAILRAQFRKAYEEGTARRQQVREYAESGVPVPQKVLEANGLKKLLGNLRLEGRHDDE